MLRTILFATASIAAAIAGALLLSLAMTDTGHPPRADAARNITVIHKTTLEPFAPAAPAPCAPGQCQDV